MVFHSYDMWVRQSGVAIVFALFSIGEMTSYAQEIETTNDMVGRMREDVIVTPVNQRLTPVGKQVELPGMRPQAIAISPDGKTLVTSGKTSELVVIDPESGDIRARVPFPDESQITPPAEVSSNILKPDKKALVSYTGLVFSPDGKRILLSNVNGSLKVFSVDDAGKISPSHSIPLPNANAPRRPNEIPSGLAFSDDGKNVYVCGNLSNKLLELELESGKVLRTFDVGAAPYDVAIVGRKAFVSNWAGRRPGPGDLTGPAGRGTQIRVDPIRFIASEGSVSVVDLDNGAVHELPAGLHASGLAVSPDKKYVVCANAGADNLSLIDVASETVVETLWVKSNPADLFGASPNALVFHPDGEHLYVANGTQNAIAVMEFDPEDKGESLLKGLIPVGWFPGAIAFDKNRGELCVANIKGLPIDAKKRGDTSGFNSHNYHGTVSLVPLPNNEQLAVLSELAAKNMRRESIAATKLPPRENQPARAIPERIGEASLIEHVVYVIKENRTYDQVLGDIKQGNGNAELCTFGQEITPNQHAMVQQFVLLDNTYCCGILSADGHQWSTTAFSTDYLEKSFAGFPRSYPDGMGDDEVDAIAYSPAGFLWDNAVLHKKSIRNYGEFMIPAVKWKDPTKKGGVDFLSCFKAWKGITNDVEFASKPAIESVKPFSPTHYVGWDMSVPDQYRADVFIRELHEFEAKGEYPNLTIICLPNDHTSGTSARCPTPAACMADNDLAFGRIVDALSHSKFWPKMAIFAIEDDPQAGWDHVSGYRTTAYCISPYAKREVVVSTQYNTTSLIRTMEQILGLPPMNQFDASATPMFDCFVNTPDLRPFNVLPVSVPLDQMNPDPKAIINDLLRSQAELSATLNFREVDRAPEDVLNRILWHAMKGASVAYPEWAITAVVDDDDDEFEMESDDDGDDDEKEADEKEGDD